MTIAPLLAALTTASALSNAIQTGAVGETFDIEGVVASDCRPPIRDFAVVDSSGAVIISPVKGMTNQTFRAGEVIRARGTVGKSHYGHVFADCSSISQVGHGAAPLPLDATIDQIANGECDTRVVRTSGLLRDCFTDEVDNQYLFAILNDGNATLYAVLDKEIHGNRLGRLDNLIGTRITLTGLCNPYPSGCRRHIGRIVRASDIAELDSPKATAVDPFDVPPAGSVHDLQPSDLSKSGRRRTTGRVLATWKKRHLIIRTAENAISRVDLAQDGPPAAGKMVEVVGFPETDLYHLNFSRAIWRQIEGEPAAPETAKSISSKDLTFNELGRRGVSAGLYGKTVSIEGTVRSLPSTGTGESRLYLENDGIVVPIDVSSAPCSADNVTIGCVVRVTGICVMDVENWRPNLVFPHVNEVFVVARTPGDLVVLKRPPWWTPAKLAAVIGSLITALFFTMLWNRSLRALAERRGKALASEELERLASDLKAQERTRLSVDLHDSISQCLSGVSMELGSAAGCPEPLPPSAALHLTRASKALDSCRVELRNCIWDLRSRALDEPEMDKAVQIALGPTIGRAALDVNFNVPRSRFTENTARAILNIVRELASNAIRHGNADRIEISGSLAGDVLRFSVCDNGTGFDPEHSPGVPDGHFGLQGIRERIAAFNGAMDIVSTSGQGSKITVTMHTPLDEDRDSI